MSFSESTLKPILISFLAVSRKYYILKRQVKPLKCIVYVVTWQHNQKSNTCPEKKRRKPPTGKDSQAKELWYLILYQSSSNFWKDGHLRAIYSRSDYIQSLVCVPTMITMSNGFKWGGRWGLHWSPARLMKFMTNTEKSFS